MLDQHQVGESSPGGGERPERERREPFCGRLVEGPLEREDVAPQPRQQVEPRANARVGELGQVDVEVDHAGQHEQGPQVEGTVSYVSADLTKDTQTNNAYYTVRVTLPGEERRRLGDVKLVSGMPVEVFLQTGSRTMMSYMFKPISDQFHRMFNER